MRESERFIKLYMSRLIKTNNAKWNGERLLHADEL